MNKNGRLPISSILTDLDGKTSDWTDQYISDKADSQSEKILSIIDKNIEAVLTGEIQSVADNEKVYYIEKTDNPDRGSYVIPEDLLFTFFSDLISGDYSGCRTMIRKSEEYLSQMLGYKTKRS